MNSTEHFNLTTFTDTTKRVCTCSAISIVLIILFIISPLSSFFFTSLFMKIIIIIILSYTLYLNFQQTNYLRNASELKISKEVANQLNINIMCSYLFSLFIGLLIIFVIKSFL
jgi:hypothetical protein